MLIMAQVSVPLWDTASKQPTISALKLLHHLITGLDKHLGVNYDPTSTDVRDMHLFKECVQKFQESNNLIERCQLGVQWNPSIAATLGVQKFGHYIEVTFI